MSYQLETNKVNVAELKVGMYVSRLDIPWIKTDYPVQGFMLRTEKDIQKVCSYSDFVYIDIKKSNQQNFKRKSENNLLEKTSELPSQWKKNFCGIRYESSEPLRKEIQFTAPLLLRVSSILKDIKPDAENLSSQNVKEIHNISKNIIGSALRNPDALIWLCTIKNKNEAMYDHSVRCAIWSILLARQLGVKEDYMILLCQAMLLSSVGKSDLSKEELISYDPDDTTSEFFNYIPKTLNQLRHSQTLNTRVLTVINNLAERYNGMGVPDGKQGTKIPFLAQIGSIAETYEMLMRPFFVNAQSTTVEALNFLYARRHKLFCGSLVEAFIQAIGIYPTGSRVLLSDNSQAVVIEQTQEKRIRSLLALVKDSHGNELKSPIMIDLADKKYQDLKIDREISELNISDTLMSDVNKLIVNKQKKWLLF